MIYFFLTCIFLQKDCSPGSFMGNGSIPGCASIPAEDSENGLSWSVSLSNQGNCWYKATALSKGIPGVDGDISVSMGSSVGSCADSKAAIDSGQYIQLYVSNKAQVTPGLIYVDGVHRMPGSWGAPCRETTAACDTTTTSLPPDPCDDICQGDIIDWPVILGKVSGVVPGNGPMVDVLGAPNDAIIDSCCPNSPIVIDLDDDGFAFGGRENPVAFDLMGRGTLSLLTWVRPGGNDAFLVQDLNQNGIVDDGSELFGIGTRMMLYNNKPAPNGFLGLAQYDLPELGGNGDSYITDDDKIWEYLYLWIDHDANGISEPHEMLPVDTSAYTSFNTVPRETRIVDANGNWLRYWSTCQRYDGSTRAMVDVFFQELSP